MHSRVACRRATHRCAAAEAPAPTHAGARCCSTPRRRAHRRQPARGRRPDSAQRLGPGSHPGAPPEGRQHPSGAGQARWEGVQGSPGSLPRCSSLHPPPPPPDPVPCPPPHPAGLRPQHLTGLQLIAELSGGQLQGGAVGSSCITLSPGRLTCGRHVADTRTAGSCMLLAQSALPALLFAGGSGNGAAAGAAADAAAARGAQEAQAAAAVQKFRPGAGGEGQDGGDQGGRAARAAHALAPHCSTTRACLPLLYVTEHLGSHRAVS